MDEHNIAHSPKSTSGDPLGPRPVSAKAVYRLADKLDLQALKLRAFQHIIAGLTAQNVPAEVFSRFSSTFEDVRKVSLRFPSKTTPSPSIISSHPNNEDGSLLCFFLGSYKGQGEILI